MKSNRDRQNITIRVAGERLALSVIREDEEIYRKAGNRLKKKIEALNQRYPTLCVDSIVNLATFPFVSQITRNKFKNKNDGSSSLLLYPPKTGNCFDKELEQIYGDARKLQKERISLYNERYTTISSNIISKMVAYCFAFEIERSEYMKKFQAEHGAAYSIL